MFKKIEAILRPYKVKEVIELLKAKNVFFYLEESKGYGKRLSPLVLYGKDKTGAVESLPRTKVTFICELEQAKELIAQVLEKSETGIVGDGKVFQGPILKTIDIHTREVNG